jgi:hypothetical protein
LNKNELTSFNSENTSQASKKKIEDPTMALSKLQDALVTKAVAEYAKCEGPLRFQNNILREQQQASRSSNDNIDAQN